MGKIKWIAGFIGWVAWGPIGGLIGFFVGQFVDTQMDGFRRIASGETSGQGGRWQQTTSSRSYTAGEQRNSFMISLLVLSSAVIRADGRTLQVELDYVRDFIRRQFGEAAVSEAMRILDGLNSQQINVYEVGTQIADHMNYSQRLQLFHYLVQIATSDGDFSASEKSVLEAIAGAMRIGKADASSIMAMYDKTGPTGLEAAYAVLEISATVSDDEVKIAYRRMAMKHHPDKVASLGPDVQKAAEEKFRKIQEAYETIKKHRGMH